MDAISIRNITLSSLRTAFDIKPEIKSSHLTSRVPKLGFFFLGLFKECQAVVSGFNPVEVRWINRSANGVADCVAKLSLSRMVPLSWCWKLNPPVKIRGCLVNDKSGWRAL
ncbi:uncharacterized protein G2W53_003413 [Senna tora]|uniref:RNase H type-1 domain-containing protein n=1 Tax=Senna tora TaxID=362788 RepID=A0A834XAI4_9FABA|nr:uncharacterized protein G2W53_003413 [Senna tora]